MNLYLKIAIVVVIVYAVIMIVRFVASLLQGEIKGSGKDVLVNILTLGGCKSEAVIVNC